MKLLPEWAIVFIWFILSLMIFYSGHLYSNDTVSKIESARNVIKHGSFEVSGYNGAWGRVGRDGKTYPHFSIGSVLIMIPPVLIYETLSAISGKPLPKFVQSVLVSGFNLICTTLIGMLFFLLFKHLGKSSKRSFIYANIIIFTSEIWQYSSTGWSEPAALLWGLLGFAILIIGKSDPMRQPSNQKWVLWAMCALIASLIRLEYITFFIFFLFITFLYNKTQWKSYIPLLFIICTSMIIHMGFNFYRFESFFNFGYFGQVSNKSVSMAASGANSIMEIIYKFFPKNYLRTIYRIYISFGRVHWFWVSPLLILSPLVIFYKKIPLLIKQVFIAACFQLCIITAIGSNSWCWGNRYLYTTFPYLLLPVFFLPLEIKNLSRAFKIFSVVGFIISLFAVLVNTHYAQELLVGKYGYHKAMWESTSNFINAPFWLHVKLFPKMIVNTLSLMIKGNNLPPWELLRTNCLDIWPVGLCGAGINSFISFGLWFVLIITNTVFGIKIIKPTFLENKKA